MQDQTVSIGQNRTLNYQNGKITMRGCNNVVITDLSDTDSGRRNPNCQTLKCESLNITMQGCNQVDITNHSDTNSGRENRSGREDQTLKCEFLNLVLHGCNKVTIRNHSNNSWIDAEPKPKKQKANSIKTIAYSYCGGVVNDQFN